MTVTIPKRIADYFKTPDNLIVAVNNIGCYLSIPRLQGITLSISGDVPTHFEIDETELDDKRLMDENLLVLVAAYAMGVGE